MSPKAVCERCGAEMVFYPSAATGKPIPLDPYPVDIGGNVYLDNGRAVVCKKGESHDEALYSTHFATCKGREGAKVADDDRVVSPLEAVRRVRREVEEERAAKRALEAEQAAAERKERDDAYADAEGAEAVAVQVGQDDGS